MSTFYIISTKITPTLAFILQNQTPFSKTPLYSTPKGPLIFPFLPSICFVSMVSQHSQAPYTSVDIKTHTLS